MDFTIGVVFFNRFRGGSSSSETSDMSESSDCSSGSKSASVSRPLFTDVMGSEVEYETDGLRVNASTDSLPFSAAVTSKLSSVSGRSQISALKTLKSYIIFLATISQSIVTLGSRITSA